MDKILRVEHIMPSVSSSWEETALQGLPQDGWEKVARQEEPGKEFSPQSLTLQCGDTFDFKSTDSVVVTWQPNPSF